MYDGVITYTIKNIILQLNMNFKSFHEIYEKFLDGLDTNLLRKLLNIPDSDKLKKNGTFSRGLYYSVEGTLKYTIIKIQKLLRTTASGKKIYISVFPDFVIKYNKVSTPLIELISTTIRKGEDIFTLIDDPECLLSSEDLLHKACQKVEDICLKKNFASQLNSIHTEIYGIAISFPGLKTTLESLRYPTIYELYKTGQVFTNAFTGVLTTLNRFLKFIR